MPQENGETQEISWILGQMWLEILNEGQQEMQGNLRENAAWVSQYHDGNSGEGVHCPRDVMCFYDI